jgi:hypothetical protein
MAGRVEVQNLTMARKILIAILLASSRVSSSSVSFTRRSRVFFMKENNAIVLVSPSDRRVADVIR